VQDCGDHDSVWIPELCSCAESRNLIYSQLCSITRHGLSLKPRRTDLRHATFSWCDRADRIRSPCVWLGLAMWELRARNAQPCQSISALAWRQGRRRRCAREREPRGPAVVVSGQATSRRGRPEVCGQSWRLIGDQRSARGVTLAKQASDNSESFSISDSCAWADGWQNRLEQNDVSRLNPMFDPKRENPTSCVERWPSRNVY
jgi:hypothetical protein